MDLAIGKPTIKPFPNFHCEDDCKSLKEALMDEKANEKTIITIITKRSSAQRQAIVAQYNAMFQKDLIRLLKSKLCGDVDEVIEQLMNDPISSDAKSLRDAMKGAGTDEATLTEIICTRSGPELLKIAEQYKKVFNRDLEKDVISETTGYYRQLLVSCLQGKRTQLTDKQVEELKQKGSQAIVDVELAKREAGELYGGGKVKFGTDESHFIRIFSTRNAFQLAATFKFYENLSGRDIVSSIHNDASGYLANALETIIMSQLKPVWYFSNRLYKSMVGLGTNNSTLIRIIISRSEIDLRDIKQQFYKEYEHELNDFVSSETSGDYRKILLSIIDGN